MPVSDHRLGNQLLGADNCPHCGVAAPLMISVWKPDKPTKRTDGGDAVKWAAFCCTSCGGAAIVKCCPGSESSPMVQMMFPGGWDPDEAIPERARNYLSQAKRTLANPDASVVMSASSIDAMLKNEELTKGSLHNRINEAVAAGIITQGMADWAHRVRLDANNPRHADEDDPHMSAEDAARAFDYAKALAEILYVLPSRMPPEPDNGGE